MVGAIYLLMALGPLVFMITTILGAMLAHVVWLRGAGLLRTHGRFQTIIFWISATLWVPSSFLLAPMVSQLLNTNTMPPDPEGFAVKLQLLAIVAVLGLAVLVLGSLGGLLLLVLKRPIGRIPA